MGRWSVVLACAAGCGFSGSPSAPDALDATPAAPGTWSAVAAGEYLSCGLHDDGGLWCWGRSDYGAIGIGPTDPEVHAPAQVGAATWSSIAVGRLHVCGIQHDGSLWCWGLNTSDQVGTTAPTTDVPIAIMAGTTWTAVAAGYAHTCAITSDHALWCWGDNTNLELGDADPGLQPRVVMPGETWKTVAAGSATTCAIRTDGSMWCFGNALYGNLGIGIRGNFNVAPTQVAGMYSRVSMSYLHTCAIRTDGRMRCFGNNERGELGDGTLDRQSVPVPVGDDAADWTEIGTGFSQSCGIRADGSLWCWGDDELGQIAVTSALGQANPVPSRVGADLWASVGIGYHHSCAVTRDHHLRCTGFDSRGELGDGHGSHLVPTRIDGAWRSVATGFGSTCATRDSGTACWGDGTYDQIGDGELRSRPHPVAIATDVPHALAAAGRHACTIGSDGEVRCWGDNEFTQLGDATIGATYSVPIVVPNVAAATAISAHWYYSCAVPSAGPGLSCWGRNDKGQLGTGDANAYTGPKLVQGSATFTAVGTGLDHACGRTTTGGVHCWGDNTYGQLGDGSMTASYLGVDPLSSADAIAVGAYHTCALRTGLLSCWGYNGDGELGIAGTAKAPAQVGTATWTELAAGTSHTCGIQTDGSLWCWGGNARGQLGDGTFHGRSAPTRIGTDSTWRHVAAGNDHSCALDGGRALWCWGANDVGQIGDDTGWRARWDAVP